MGSSQGLVHLRPFGKLTYEPGAPAVGLDTLYDLASLTKVVATTLVAMVLVDEGRLDVDASAAVYLPSCLGGGERDAVRVRDLLAHSPGLPVWAPLFTSRGWGRCCWEEGPFGDEEC